MDKHDLKQDLLRSPTILEKVKEDCYAQNLYAAMCNMQWQRSEAWPILTDELWHCSWRSSGSIVANLRDEGDYMDWYCSGMGGMGALAREIDENDRWIKDRGYVAEGVVTDEIRKDLAELGWHPVPWDDKDMI